MLYNCEKGLTVGIDVGTTSLGYSVARQVNGFVKILETIGTVRFRESVNSKGTKSLASKRTKHKSVRVTLKRKAGRKKDLKKLFLESGLVSLAEIQGLSSLDSLSIRASACNNEVASIELLSALIHMSSRRGFKSNRKDAASNEDSNSIYEGSDKTSTVGVNKLHLEMKSRKCETVGQLALLKRRENKRFSFYRLRSDIEAEFDLVWEKQAAHNSRLNDSLKSIAHDIIFYQNPIPKQTDLIGSCCYIDGERRACKVESAAQEFIYLKYVNDNLYKHDGIESQTLTESDISVITSFCKAKVDNKAKKDFENNSLTSALTFPIAFIGLSKAFKKETGSELLTKRVKSKNGKDEFGKVPFSGAEYFKALLSCHGFSEFVSDKDIDNLIALFVEESEESIIINTFKDSAKSFSNLSEEKIKSFFDISFVCLSFKGRFLNLSFEAAQTINALMNTGMKEYEATKLIGYVNKKISKNTYSYLIPYNQFISENNLTAMTNNAVKRSMKEIRRVINEIIKKYGMPEFIHIELARETDKSPNKKSHNDFIAKNNAEKELAIAYYTERGLVIENGELDGTLLKRHKLWIECNKITPYTGVPIPAPDDRMFEIEHMIPSSLGGSDSIHNLTLATIEENAFKGERAPCGAYADNAPLYKDMLERVSAFSGANRDKKLNIFKAHGGILDNVISEESLLRHGVDTSYTAREVRNYLSTIVAPEKIFSIRAHHVAMISDYLNAHKISRKLTMDVLRADYQTNIDFSDKDTVKAVKRVIGRKGRQTNYHHAVDAAVIALITPKFLAKYLKSLEHKYKNMTNPVLKNESYMDAMNNLVKEMNISWSSPKETIGQLHDESIFGIRGSESDYKITNAFNRDVFGFKTKLLEVTKVAKTSIFKLEKGIKKFLPEKDIIKITDKRIQGLYREWMAQGDLNAPLLIPTYRNGKRIVSRCHKVTMTHEKASLISLGRGRYASNSLTYCLAVLKNKVTGNIVCTVITGIEAMEMNGFSLDKRLSCEFELLSTFKTGDLIKYDNGVASIIATINSKGRIVFYSSLRANELSIETYDDKGTVKARGKRAQGRSIAVSSKNINLFKKISVSPLGDVYETGCGDIK